MSQFDFGTIDPSVKTGTQLAIDLNTWRDALHTSHAGVAQPSYAVPGMLWLDTVSATDWRLKLATTAGDVVIGNINPTTNTLIAQKFQDGTNAAPAISWTNEPTAGWWRVAAGQFRYALGGADVLGLTASAFSVAAPLSTVLGGNASVAGTLSVTSGSTLGVVSATQISATSIQANGGSASVPLFNGVGLYGSGILATGASGTDYGSFAMSGRNSAGSVAANPFYSFIHSSGGLGTHFFRNLAGSHGSQSAAGMALTAPQGGGAQLGVGRSMILGSDTFGRDDWQVINPTAGAVESVWRCAIAVNSALLADGNIKIENTATNIPHLVINAGMNATLTGVSRASLYINASSVSQNAGICMLSVSSAPLLMMEQTGVLYWGWESLAGPLGGWAMSLGWGGNVTAGSYTPCDAALKTDVRPIEGALVNVLKLKGVRFKNKHDGAENAGLVAQDVQAVFPELIGKWKSPSDPDAPEILTVQYGALSGAIVEAIRELAARVTTLESAP